MIVHTHRGPRVGPNGTLSAYPTRNTFLMFKTKLWVAASRPKVLAMALSQGQKTIAKLRLTLPPGLITSLSG